MSSRWCSSGNHCVRIHPVKKSKYIAHVIAQSVKVSRLNLYDYSDSEEDERDISTTSLRQEQSTQRVTSSGAERSQSSPLPGFHDPPIKVKLPPPSPILRQHTPTFPQTQNSAPVPRHRVTQSMPLSSLSPMESRDDVHNWDTVTGFNNPPGSPRASSDAGSSTSGGDNNFPWHLYPCNPRDWEIHTEESAWSDSNATVDESPPRPPLKRTGTTVSSNTTVVVKSVAERLPVPSDPRDWEIRTEESDWIDPNAKNDLERTPVLPASLPVVKKHYRPRNRHRCERWVRNKCDLGFDCKYVHDDLDYDSDEPVMPSCLLVSFSCLLTTSHLDRNRTSPSAFQSLLRRYCIHTFVCASARVSVWKI